jgi:excisionase family DNA binding protein
MRYYSTTEAADILHVDPSRVRLLCKLGRIKTIKVGNTYGIAEDELDRFAAIQRQPGKPRGIKLVCQQASATAPFEHGVESC